MALLDFDPVEHLHGALLRNRRPPDGLLHPSGDLIGSLRHSMLRAAGAPTLESDVVSEFRLGIGTMIHAYLEDNFRGVPIINEVKLDRWLPEGWTGTADALVWNAEYKAFVLVDYKSCKPEAIHYLLRDGIKDSHLWQASCYWHAAAQMGIPLVRGFGIFNLPMSQLRSDKGFIQPVFAEAEPLPKELVWGVMAERWQATKAYLADVRLARVLDPDLWVIDTLAPVQERELWWGVNKGLKSGPVIDVKLKPNWSTEFCPYPLELCNCSQQGVNKIGHWSRLESGHLQYHPAKGWEEPLFPEDMLAPQKRHIDALIKAEREA